MIAEYQVPGLSPVCDEKRMEEPGTDPGIPHTRGDDAILYAMDTTIAPKKMGLYVKEIIISC